MIKKTEPISAFKDKISVWTMKVSTHIYVKNIQRKAIKAERENAKKDPHHLVLQIDFPENWAVIHNKIVQNENMIQRMLC